jgi:hypothetical protein
MGGFTPHHLTQSHDGAREVYAVDLDKDTDMDILSVAGGDTDDLTWWENDGNQNFTENTIDGDFNGSRSVTAADIDGDTDLDILASSWDDDDVVWWENNGNVFTISHRIDSYFNGADTVIAVDLDQDSDTDILGTADQEHEIGWWENDGTSADGSWSYHVIDSGFMGANDAVVVDVDGDADLDVIGAAWMSNQVAWWENNGSQVFDKHLIDTDFDTATSLLSIDLDGDNDMDIVGAASGADDVAWWQNDGTGNFKKHMINENFNGANSVFAIDLDKDLDPDIAAVGFDADSLTWWEHGKPLTDLFLPLLLNKAEAPKTSPTLYPIENSDGDYMYVVEWSSVDGATGYTLEGDEDLNYPNPTTIYSGEAVSTTVYAPNTGTFYYHVKASNIFGESPWSETQSVDVTEEPPPCPQNGSWEGTTNQGYPISFMVSNVGGCKLPDLAIKYRTNCFTVRTTFLNPYTISNFSFDTGGKEPNVKGSFDSAISATGSWSYEGVEPGGYRWCTGYGTWSADYIGP